MKKGEKKRREREKKLGGAERNDGGRRAEIEERVGCRWYIGWLGIKVGHRGERRRDRKGEGERRGSKEGG